MHQHYNSNSNSVPKPTPTSLDGAACGPQHKCRERGGGEGEGGTQDSNTPTYACCSLIGRERPAPTRSWPRAKSLILTWESACRVTRYGNCSFKELERRWWSKMNYSIRSVKKVDDGEKKNNEKGLWYWTFFEVLPSTVVVVQRRERIVGFVLKIEA